MSRAPNVFSGAPLDRSHRLRRDDAALALARSHPDARAVPVWRSRSLVVMGEVPAVAPLPLAQAEALLASPEIAQTVVLLGQRDGTPYLAFDLSSLDESQAAGIFGEAFEFVDLRQIGALVSHDDGALLAYARAIVTWHQRARFCGRCGQATESRQGGHVRACGGCGSEEFPRSDPAVIMLVHDDEERCLLGRQSSWPPGVYSTLAGFVEPGESLEHAVAREVQEETGVPVEDVRYHSSQPWPFPASIMLGFFARATDRRLELDPEEIEDARWFGREELRELCERREVRLPPPLSIARRLIEDWLADRGP